MEELEPEEEKQRRGQVAQEAVGSLVPDLSAQELAGTLFCIMETRSKRAFSCSTSTNHLVSKAPATATGTSEEEAQKKATQSSIQDIHVGQVMCTTQREWRNKKERDCEAEHTGPPKEESGQAEQEVEDEGFNVVSGHVHSLML